MEELLQPLLDTQLPLDTAQRWSPRRCSSTATTCATFRRARPRASSRCPTSGSPACGTSTRAAGRAVDKETDPLYAWVEGKLTLLEEINTELGASCSAREVSVRATKMRRTAEARGYRGMSKRMSAVSDTSARAADREDEEAAATPAGALPRRSARVGGALRGRAHEPDPGYGALTTRRLLATTHTHTVFGFVGGESTSGAPRLVA